MYLYHIACVYTFTESPDQSHHLLCFRHPAEPLTVSSGRRHQVSLKPRSLSHVEAASLPYAAATAWSALVVTGELITECTRRDRRVLVCGAAGGVGTLAVQLLKAWGCEVWRDGVGMDGVGMDVV